MERREQLIAAAVAGELTAEERRELDAWCAEDPDVARQLAEMTALVARIDSADVRWTEIEPPAALGASIEGAVARESAAPRRRIGMLAAAAVLLMTGAGVGVGVERAVDTPVAAPTGPPGTMGAVEPIAASTDLAGASVDLSLIAHTWGTETVMTLDGFAPGQEYAVVLLDRDGTPVDSGSFIGSTVAIDCRMNAALLREDVSAVEIVESDGTVVVDAPVPSVGT